MRQNALNETLKNINIHNKYKYNILISDHSETEIKIKNKRIVNKYKEYNNIKILDLPFDSGLSKSRNLLVSKCKTKYLMILDDSRYFKEDLPILKMIKFLENTNYDLIGGRILNRDKYSCLFNSINKKKERN